MPIRPGDFDERIIDREFLRAASDKYPKTEIRDPVEIEKKLKRARALFNGFMHNRSKIISYAKGPHYVDFEITTEAMLLNLDIADIPRVKAMERLDEMILSQPGIIKTESGYKIGNKAEFTKSYGDDSMRAKVEDIFTDNPNEQYTIAQIAEKLEVSVTSVRDAVHKLEDNGKVILAGKIKRSRLEKFKKAPTANLV